MEYARNFVTSKDGTKIGYRQFGKGPGLILVHGGMMAAQNLMKLGELLADQFTIYIPDRQSRGLSEAHASFGLAPESEDLQALVHQTKAENVYGLSAGAVVVLKTSLIEERIKRIALHEPPVLTKETKLDWIEKYSAAMNRGNYGRAFISIVKGTDDPSSVFNRLPAFITAPLMNLAIKRQAKNKASDDHVTLKALVAAMPCDIQIILDSEGMFGQLKNLAADVFLIKGQKSQPYLRATIDQLSAALPHSKCVDLVGQGHTVSDNDGQPQLIAAELRRFFSTVSGD